MTNLIVACLNSSNAPNRARISIRRKFTDTFHSFIYRQLTAKIRSVQEQTLFKMTIYSVTLRVKRVKVGPGNVLMPFCMTHT